MMTIIPVYAMKMMSAEMTVETRLSSKDFSTVRTGERGKRLRAGR